MLHTPQSADNRYVTLRPRRQSAEVGVRACSDAVIELHEADQGQGRGAPLLDVVLGASGNKHILIRNGTGTVLASAVWSQYGLKYDWKAVARWRSQPQAGGVALLVSGFFFLVLGIFRELSRLS